MKIKIIAQDKEHLKKLIEEEMTLHGNECDLNHIDTSLVKDISYLFFNSKFNGDISKWNTSNVTNMGSVFSYSIFTGDISNWDTRNVTDMAGMFFSSHFKGDISQWNISNVHYMQNMFYQSQFNHDISHWKLGYVLDMSCMFDDCEYEKPWWAIEDNHKRKIALDNYQLMQKLEDKLISKETKLHLKKI